MLEPRKKATAVEAMILSASSPMDGCCDELGDTCGGTHTDCYYAAILDAAVAEIVEALRKYADEDFNPDHRWYVQDAADFIEREFGC